MISKEEILKFKDRAKDENKSDEYITALSDFYKFVNDKELEERKSLRELVRKKRRESVSNTKITKLYFYERKLDGTIRKTVFKAEEKASTYKVFNCWRVRLSKHHDINKYTDCLKHAMWTDVEDDELMEKLLEKY